ncbi:MAG: AmmeMemoRadiSam system radical SAM enzyme [Candidatus Bipolaricaulaceae bacterium]
MREAMLWEGIGEGRVRCYLCAHRCLIPPGGRGVCAVRENRGGKLYSLVYGRLVARALDPVEKKPLFHFLPGTGTLSLATVGCNFRCDFCQNYEISQLPREQGRIVGERAEPEEVVEAAKDIGARSISYTYTEPTVFFEFCRDVGSLAVVAELKNIFVTNGYMTEDALAEAKGWLHAANVDLKSFSEDFYRRFCGASLGPVLETIARMWEAGIWVEVTTLVIPGRNDSEEELRWIAQFLAGISPDIPWHISRFVPAYKVWDLPPTPLTTLRKAQEIGLSAGLHFVYLGNVPGEGEDTFCPSCGRVLVRRHGFFVQKNEIIEGHCPHCGAPIPGIWS